MTRSRITRRRFLGGAAVGAASVLVQPILATRRLYAAPQGNPGRFVVVINMLGGNDGLNMVVPAHLASYVDRRPNLNLADAANLPAGETLPDLDGRFRLHYALDGLKSLWDDGDLHVVHKVSYPSPNQSHFTSQDIFSYGVRQYAKDGDGRGWLGRFADLYCASPAEPLGVVSVGVGRRRDFESDIVPPLVLGSQLVDGAGNETFKVDEDREAGQDGALRAKVVRDTLAADAEPSVEPARTVFETNRLAYDLVERVDAGIEGWEAPATPYPNTTLGRHLESISRLVHGIGDFGTRVFYTGYGGFDTHSGQHSPGGNSRHEQLMRQLDDAVGVFAADMKAKGQWNNCCIVVISEFGRRVFENGSLGTDHGWGNAFLLFGGRVKGRHDAGGGMTGDIAEDDIAANSNLPFGYDFRDIYGDIVASHLGLEPAPLFPDPGYTPSPADIDVI